MSGSIRRSLKAFNDTEFTDFDPFKAAYADFPEKLRPQVFALGFLPSQVGRMPPAHFLCQAGQKHGGRKRFNCVGLFVGNIPRMLNFLIKSMVYGGQ